MRATGSCTKCASHDGLTGVYNRRTFDIILADEFDRASRYGRELSLLVMDIDHFKQVNDTYGHVAGDQILIEFAQEISKQLRGVDLLARYGGEEFVVILPETSMEMALLIAERIRKSIEEQQYQANDDIIRITTSAGVCSYPDQANTAEELIHHADSALYEAKQTGRNRVSVFTTESVET